MDTMTVTVTDATGTKVQEVTAPTGATAIRLTARLVQAMGLPMDGPDGIPMSYRLHHRETARQLRDDETLLGAGVTDGSTLRLVAKITAG